jgi:dimethylhistidine N-methyltransferase
MDRSYRLDPKAPRLEEFRPAPRLTLLCQPQQDQRRELREAVERGLVQTPKQIPPRFFYDDEGSRLFERITATPEYYPTRTEASILQQYGSEILAAAFGTRGGYAASGAPTMVELGSGSSAKTRLLLDAFGREQALTYMPIDVSADAVRTFGLSLLTDYPALSIQGLVCDYHDAAELLRSSGVGPRLFLFLGSSLGNYDQPEAHRLLALMRSAMGPRDRFLLGLDLKKDEAVLNAAYNDAEGVTAAFNLNLLVRINADLGGHFNLAHFAHLAFYNGSAGRIEMHLESLEDQVVRIDALGRSYGFRRGERLHTENSYKYGPGELAALLQGTGLAIERQWFDTRGWFSLNLLAPA